MWHLAYDKCWVNAVSLAEICRGHTVEHEQHDPNHQEQGKLEEDCQATG